MKINKLFYGTKLQKIYMSLYLMDRSSFILLFLSFIDDERNKEVEIKFGPYLNEYSNFKEKNDSLLGESVNNEEEVANE